LHAIYTHTWATDDKGETKSSYYATVAHEHNLSINSKYFIFKKNCHHIVSKNSKIQPNKRMEVVHPLMIGLILHR
jgi:hypothetical protein